MEKNKIIQWGAKFLICGTLLHGASASALTLNEYLDQVKGDSTAYKGSAEQSEGAQLKSREADLIFTPKLFAEARWGYDGKPGNPKMYDEVKSQYYSLGVSQQFSFGLQTKLSYDLNRTQFEGLAPTSPINPSKYWDATPKLELSMPLWANGFGRTAQANEEALRAQNLAEKFSSQGQSLNILAGAEAAYWKLAAWQDVVTIQEQAKQAAQSILDYVSRKKRMNLGEEADVLQARALVEARTLELQVAQNEYLEAQRMFNKFLNREATAKVETLEKVNYKSLEQLTIPGARPGSRADVEATNAQLAAARANAVITLERNRPSLDIYGNYAMNGRDEEYNEAMKESGKTDQDTAFVGVRFSMPLNIGAASDTKAGARKAERAAELNREYAYYAQEIDWTNLTRNLQDARDNLRLLSRIEDAQKAKLENERVRLRQGRTTTYQVLLFEQDYTTSAISKVKSAANILGLQAQIKLYQASPEGGK
ncbi:TolC family protein [Bdellovibrio bacteriovorus]|uniref:TolC family protein n=1 Tax=Bdellovibrio bacteriovorus TaxID=959 RepID=UPI003AA94B6F